MKLRYILFFLFWGGIFFTFIISMFNCESLNGGRCNMTLENTNVWVFFSTFIMFFISLGSGWFLAKCPSCGKTFGQKVFDLKGLKTCSKCMGVN